MRLRNREVTPSNPVKPHCNSLTRARFYHAFDHRNDLTRVPAQHIFNQFSISRSTAYDWLPLRDEISNISGRRHDGRVEKQLLRGTRGSGRPYKITDSQLQQLLAADQTTRRQPLKTQLQEAHIEASRRTVQRSLRTRMNAGMFRASTQKNITEPQAAQRQSYAAHNQYQPIIGY
jgi:transposase